MGFNPGSTFGATDLRIGARRGQHAARRRASASSWRWRATNAKYGKPDISMSCNGMLAGLVAITAPCAFVAPWAAVDHRRRSPACSSSTASRSSTTSRTSTTRAARSRCTACAARGACSRSGSSPTAPTATAGTASTGNGQGALLRRRRPARARRSSHVVVGFVWAWGVTWLIFTIAKRFMQIRVVARGRDRRASTCPSSARSATPTSCSRRRTDPAVTHRAPSSIERTGRPRPGGTS